MNKEEHNNLSRRIAVRIIRHRGRELLWQINEYGVYADMHDATVKERLHFNWLTLEGLGRMAVWWANNYGRYHDESGLVSMLSAINPNYELAKAIEEVINNE